jgi:hypothetical protein
MKVELLSKGYFSEQLRVTEEEGEILTKEMVEERFSYPFGCVVHGKGPIFYVDSYLD